VKHEKAQNPAFDCFYVYPTVKLTSDGPMTDFSKIDITLDPLLAQGARFSRLCRVYAPLYRQNGVVPGAGGAPTPGATGFDLGQQDVRDAFKYYLEHLNQGRKFVLLGHSQGTGMLTGVIAKDVDPQPEVRKQLISALLIGGGVTVPAGGLVGGSFQNVPLCNTPGQLGCVVAYNSFSRETPAGAMSTFGRSTNPAQEVACTEPAALAGRTGQRYAGSYVSLRRVNAGFVQDGFDRVPKDVDTPFLVYRDVFRGECKRSAGASYLEISLEQPAGDQRVPPPYHSAAIESALGLHLVDYNLELDDLIETVRLQATAALR
jgi:pimeloyl-ACP methyl ester carboxylesterase